MFIMMICVGLGMHIHARPVGITLQEQPILPFFGPDPSLASVRLGWLGCAMGLGNLPVSSSVALEIEAHTS